MPDAAPPTLAAAAAYTTLRRAVQATLLEGQRAAENAAISASWHVGRLIHEHVLRYQDRPDYGARTLRQLAADVSTSERVLYRCWLFARAYEISPPAAKLTCAHYFALSRLEPGPQRDTLAAEAERRGWVVKELEQQVTATLGAMGSPNNTASPPASPRSTI